MRPSVVEGGQAPFVSGEELNLTSLVSAGGERRWQMILCSLVIDPAKTKSEKIKNTHSINQIQDRVGYGGGGQGEGRAGGGFRDGNGTESVPKIGVSGT